MGICNEFIPLLLLRAAATCWSLWFGRNDLIFENKQAFFSGYLQSITLASYMGYPPDMHDFEVPIDPMDEIMLASVQEELARLLSVLDHRQQWGVSLC